jgi:hypothetical protein
MEEPLSRQALLYSWYSLQTGSIPASCQSSTMSALCAIPPIVQQSLPGAGPLRSLSLGCVQASILALTRVELNQVAEVVDDHGRYVVPTFVICKPTPLKTTTAHSLTDSRSAEIALSNRQTHSFETCTEHVDDWHIKPKQGIDLEARSLTIHDIFTMSTTVTEAPGSPPDRSGSRSSKSSSYSSTFSTPEGLDSDDITNYEEIGLDDAQPKVGHRRDVSMQSVNSEYGLMKTKQRAEKRPALPQLQTQVKVSGPIQVSAPSRVNGSRFGMFKRGFTTPEAFQQPNRPRSSSPPSRRNPSSSSTPSLSAGTLRPGLHPAASLGPPSRRASWQPQRKTIRELEAEYHDSDDDLPEDASLWNVPVSPFATGQRSHRPSFRGSPERLQPMMSPRPIPLEHARTAPDTPPTRHTFHSQHLPRTRPPSVRSASLTPTSSNPSSPKKPGFGPKNRTKSWNIAMADLSEEARIISETLEFHAATREQEKLDKMQRGVSEESLDTISDRGARTSSIQLPPIQKSTLDFMPMSKEKEAVLSRTRPSWLPPKDPKEERKHLKEYQRMMAASMEAEKQRTDKLQTQQTTEDATRQSLQRIWHYYIQDDTDLATIDQRVDDLCWRGITPSLRGKVWQRKIGNSLGLNDQSYQKALSRAKDIKQKSAEQLDHDEKSMGRWFVDIERDAETAFPELNLFQRQGPMWQDLIDVCEAYACYRSDVGYVYGMQLIAAMVLLQTSTPSAAFVLMANCLSRSVPLAFQTNETATMSKTYNHAISTLGIKFPRLHEYLFGSVEQGGLGFRGEEIFEPMLRTVFSNGLDVDRLSRTWDIWIFEGDRSLISAAVAILGSLQSQLLSMSGNIDLRRRNIQEMLGWGPYNRMPQSGHWNLTSVGSEEHFVGEIRLAGRLDYKGQ